MTRATILQNLKKLEPQDMLAKAQQARQDMIEKIAETDDVAMEKFLEDEEISIDEIKRVTRKATLDLKNISSICWFCSKTQRCTSST